MPACRGDAISTFIKGKVTVTGVLSKGFAPYVDAILEGKMPEPLEKAMVIRDGEICDERIRAFREARGIPCAY